MREGEGGRGLDSEAGTKGTGEQGIEKAGALGEQRGRRRRFFQMMRVGGW
jgi:hypothetical protein